MLQQMRNPYVMRYGMWIILGVSIPAFVMFYGFQGTGKSHPALTGTLVTVKTKSGKVEMDRQALGQVQDEAVNFYLGIARQLGAQDQQMGNIQNAVMRGLKPKDVADFAVANVAMRERSEEQGIRVTNEQVSSYLRKVGITRETLPELLRARHMSETQFSDLIRADIADNQARATVSRVARASLLELWQEYLLSNEKLTVSYTKIPVTRNAEEAITPEELKGRYDDLVKAKDALTIDAEKRVYRYVSIPAPANKDTQPTPEQLKKAYDEAPATDAELSGPGGTEISQILLPYTKAAGEKESAKARATAALERVTAGEAFGKVANEYSVDLRNLQFNDSFTTPTLRGGKLPYRLLGSDDEAAAWGEEYRKFVRDSAPGTTSGILDTPNGYALLRVEGRLEAGKVPYDEAVAVLKKRLGPQLAETAKNERDQVVADNYRKMLSAASESTTLEGIARSIGSSVQETSPTLSTSTFLRGFGNLSNEKITLDSLKVGALSSVVQATDGTSGVVVIKEVIAERTKTVDEIKASLENKIRGERALKTAEATAETIKARILKGDNLTSVGLELSYDAKTLDAFKRPEAPQEFRMITESRKDFANGTKDEIFVRKAGSGDFVQGVYVIRIEKVEQPKKDDFLKEIGPLEARLLNAKRQGYVEDFRRDAVATLKAEYSPEYIASEKE